MESRLALLSHSHFASYENNIRVCVCMHLRWGGGDILTLQLIHVVLQVIA